MSSLENQVIESASHLQKAWVEVNRTRTSTALPSKCAEHWIKRAALHDVLKGTVAIFEARAKAWMLVDGVAKATPFYSNEDPEESKSPNTVEYGKIPMEFSVARHLALTSYASITWSIYDRLANVCGRLCGIDDLRNHQKQNPKLCEHLLGETEDKEGKRKKQDSMGFGSHIYISSAYSWPIRVSYKLRNWLVHEGYEEGSVPLFKGNSIGDQFILHDDAVKLLQKVCGGASDGKRGESTCVAEKEDSWSKRDLLKILEQYNQEIDTMFTALLKWSVDSLVGQIKAFAARDQK